MEYRRPCTLSLDASDHSQCKYDHAQVQGILNKAHLDLVQT